MLTNTRFDGVIFDLDGTLLNSLQDIANSANEVLDNINRKTFTLDRYRSLVGDGVRILFERALEEDGGADDALIDQCMADWRAIYADKCTIESRPYPGILDLLERLQMQSRKLAVLSNKPDAFTKKLVEHYFDPKTFTHVIGQREGIERKPDPNGVFEIQRTWSMASDCVAYVGDTNTDMSTAVNAGVFAIGVTWGFRSKEELVRTGADRIAENAADLWEILAME